MAGPQPPESPDGLKEDTNGEKIDKLLTLRSETLELADKITIKKNFIFTSCCLHVHLVPYFQQ